MEEKPKNIEKQEISKEILSDWYKEKGISPEDVEKREKEDMEAQEKDPVFSSPSPSPSPSHSEEEEEEIKKREEEKKLVVKNKVRYLLKIGEEKGLEHSIKEAKKENDPFLLDIYHDVLAKDGAYKRLLKK